MLKVVLSTVHVAQKKDAANEPGGWLNKRLVSTAASVQRLLQYIYIHTHRHIYIYIYIYTRINMSSFVLVYFWLSGYSYGDVSILKAVPSLISKHRIKPWFNSGPVCFGSYKRGGIIRQIQSMSLLTIVWFAWFNIHPHVFPTVVWETHHFSM